MSIAKLKQSIEETLDQVGEIYLARQNDSGSWDYLLEGSVMPDAYAILTERLFPPADWPLINRLKHSIVEKQGANGAWSLYPDHPGDYSTTLEAYLALLMAGQEENSPTLQRAKSYLLSAGAHGQRLSNLTRITFASFGIVPWETVPAFPPELILLPPSGPFSIYDFVSFTRVHLPAIMLLSGGRANFALPHRHRVRALIDDRSLRITTPSSHRFTKLFSLLPKHYPRLDALSRRMGVRPLAEKSCIDYILSNMESDGTVGSYILSTLLSMLALKSYAGEEHRPTIEKMKGGLRSLIMDVGEGRSRMQPCTSTQWDTALNINLLRGLGISPSEESIQRAVAWLLKREIRQFDELTYHSPLMEGSAWGFQNINSTYPDVDDTCAVLMAIRGIGGPHAARAAQSFERGVNWVLQIQNGDGGWSAFDRNCNRALLEWLPFNDMYRAMIDPSTADMTGRTLAFLCTVENTRAQMATRRGLAWLLKNQRKDGSWFGRWGISFIYGTWAALLGFGACGFTEGQHPSVKRACDWLRSIQNPDGGWGESCQADRLGAHVPLASSTPSQTGWALGGLAAVARQPDFDRCLLKGVGHLIDTFDRSEGWSEAYPTGAGFAGKLYLQYHNYRNLWPAMALLQIHRKLRNR